MTLKIATFNVNSVKSRIPVLAEWFDSEGAPDILCLQETKCVDAEFPRYFFEDYYTSCCVSGMKSYNGVAILSKKEPDEISFGLGDAGEEGREESERARVAFARFGKLYVLNTYIPQGKEIDHPDYAYKLRFIARVRGLLERRCTPEDAVVWVGDLNVAPTDIDVTNPKNKKNHVCFHEDVRRALAGAMEWGLVDSFPRASAGGWRIHILGLSYKRLAIAQYRLAYRPYTRDEERGGPLPVSACGAQPAREGKAFGPYSRRSGIRYVAAVPASSCLRA